MPLPIAVSVGDPSGIGPEIAAKAWLDRKRHGLAPFFLLTDPGHHSDILETAGIDCPVSICDVDAVYSVFDLGLPVIPLDHRFSGKSGAPETANAPGILEAIDRAVAYCMDGKAAAITTCPIAKSVLYEFGFEFPGHTEYLAHLCQSRTGEAVTPVMMIAGPELRTVPVTIHIPLADVPRALTTDAIYETAAITAKDLGTRLGIKQPRLAISGLNPHAGESGALGKEDKAVIAPAIERLRNEGIDARGPLPADTMFHAAARATYDVAICMYHDQALIPAKAFGFDDAVNVTLGLPIIRTSPDHGTAFDIAGKGIARETSLVAALRMAGEMAAKRTA